jgi:hypothetical protein
MDLYDLLHHLVLDDFIVGALDFNPALAEYDDVVSEVQEVNGVSAQDSSLSFKHCLKNTLKNLLADLSVES